VPASDRISVLTWLGGRQDEMAELLDRLVLAESPSLVPGSERSALDLLRSELESAAFVTRRLRGDGTGDHLMARPSTRRRRARFQLISGHVDTVWPLGSIQAMPPQRDNGHYFGPGAYDMKGGLVQLIFALRALHALGLSPPLTPVIFLNSDEEIGSVDSRRHIRRLARGAVRALVLEPPASPGGALKTGRKGVSRFEVVVTGRAAHAGTSPEQGVSAILELSHLVQRLFALSDPRAGVTVNVGAIDGGLGANVIAPEASALVDVRAPTKAAAASIAQAIHSLKPTRPGTFLTVHSEPGRPPMPSTLRNRTLFKRAQRLAAELGLHIEESPLVGGASDANLTSELTATLDGLGAVGDGAHARDEHVVVSALPERAALLALLLLEPE
jgi:glutamate carboxypeptidase